MPLIVYLKDPKLQIVIEGDRLRPREWRRRLPFWPRLLRLRAKDNGAVFVVEALNVAMVREISDAEYQEARAEAQRRVEAAAAGRSQVVRPQMRIPGGH